MSNRISRIQNFKEFSNKSKQTFQNYAEKDSSNERLNSLFLLCICPKGRNGGVNDKEVEVFYGNRPIDQTTEVTSDFQTKTRLETAHGATLSYFRTDNGHVICNLYPAKSENQRPIEEAILLDYVKEPSKLNERSKAHWKMFISYMETTCIDGEPTITHRLKVFYLKNFKRVIIDKTVQEQRALKLFKELSKYVLTVGLSGFLILAFTLLKDDIDNYKQQSRYEEIIDSIKSIKQISSNIVVNLKMNNTSLEKIEVVENLNKDELQHLKDNISKSNRLLTESVVQLKVISSSLKTNRNGMDALKEKGNKNE